jgi:hypothetical protein
MGTMMRLGRLGAVMAITKSLIWAWQRTEGFPMHTIRRTIYTVGDVRVSLPFIPSLADDHPEITDGAPPPPTPPKERRGRFKWERPPRLTDAYIRPALGKDPKQAAKVMGRVKFESTMRRIMRGGV